MQVYKVHGSYSPSSYTLHSPFPLPQVSILQTYPSFSFNSKVSVQRGFLVYLSCEYAVLWSV
jgi:hypothetical protein